MRVGIAGLGAAALQLHVPALGRLGGVAELVGGCDPEAEPRARFERASSSPAFPTLTELVTAASPELLIVATPPTTHLGVCGEAAAAGLHLLCEKPLAPSLEDGHRIVSLAEEAGVALAIDHGFRFQPTLLAVGERIGSGADGALIHLQIWQLIDSPPWSEANAWRAARADQGLLEAGIHLIDLLLGLHPSEPVDVFARRAGGAAVGHPGADAIVSVSVRFADGTVGEVLSNRLHRGGDRYLEVRADCEWASLRSSWGGRAGIRAGKKRANRGGIRAEYAGGGLAWAERGLERETLARDPRRPELAGTARLIEDLITAIRSGGPIPSGGTEALRTLAVIEAAYTAIESGATEQVRAVDS